MNKKESYDKKIIYYPKPSLSIKFFRYGLITWLIVLPILISQIEHIVIDIGSWI